MLPIFIEIKIASVYPLTNIHSVIGLDILRVLPKDIQLDTAPLFQSNAVL